MIDIEFKARNEEWELFLKGHPESNIFHTHEWKQLIENTYNYKSLYMFAKNEEGTLTGLLPIFYVKSKLTGRRLCSVPFSHMCGALGDEYSKKALYKTLFVMYNEMSADLIEIRQNEKFFGFKPSNKLSTYVLDINDNLKFSLNKSIRRYVNKAEEQNETVISNDRDAIGEFYEINCLNKKKNRVTCPPLKFFVNIAKYLDEKAAFHFVYNQGRMIGGAVSLDYNKDRLSYYIGCTHPKHYDKFTSYSYIWSMANECHKRGIPSLDLGPSSPDPDNTLTSFKIRWGGREESMQYSYYPSVPSYETKQSISHKLIGIMPNSLYKRYSNMVFSKTVN
ncbi:MAG TPA: GNAT family N-acetyltransferase [Candidatus Methanofastidiosa archaeon]|nr:GNAT family N-acetyltransferase [Candidatus Methanofastidiosa archaeon]HPR42068.1 GNAT family N-acetyltransferase [Candidatus Methanofastidiosa archaeon]